MRELDSGTPPEPRAGGARVRVPGGGRKALVDRDPGLVAALERLLDPCLRMGVARRREYRTRAVGMSGRNRARALGRQTPLAAAVDDSAGADFPCREASRRDAAARRDVKSHGTARDDWARSQPCRIVQHVTPIRRRQEEWNDPRCETDPWTRSSARIVLAGSVDPSGMRGRQRRGGAPSKSVHSRVGRAGRRCFGSVGTRRSRLASTPGTN